MFTRLKNEGFKAFAFRLMLPEDPCWKLICPDENRSHSGLWLRAEGPTSRITVAIFLEGVDDEISSKLAHFAAPAAVPSSI
jgi:hypothetical protein